MTKFCKGNKYLVSPQKLPDKIESSILNRFMYQIIFWLFVEEEDK